MKDSWKRSRKLNDTRNGGSYTALWMRRGTTSNGIAGMRRQIKQIATFKTSGGRNYDLKKFHLAFPTWKTILLDPEKFWKHSKFDFKASVNARAMLTKLWLIRESIHTNYYSCVAGNSVRLLGQKRVASKKQGGASLALPKVRRNPLIEIIAINTGCLNQCTYCKTKHARGELGSYPPG